jgi:hypothetical protein
MVKTEDLEAVDAAFERLNSVLDASGALYAEATQVAAYELRLAIVRALGDSARIQAAEAMLGSMHTTESLGGSSDPRPNASALGRG